MSFSSEHAVRVPKSIDYCFDLLSDPDHLETFMRISDITDSVTVTSRDQVHLTPDHKVSELTTTDESGDREVCTRINFKLFERVEYLGIAKLIPVVGHVVISRAKRMHIEHREASAGLVITDKIRTFADMTERFAINADRVPRDEDDEDGLEDLVIDGGTLEPHDMDETGGTTSDSAGVVPTTEIREKISGSTSWYLKYFVEVEARRSHNATMDQYRAYLDRP